MKPIFVVMISLFALVAPTVAVIGTSNSETLAPQARTTLPDSLDELYPPHARGPLWLIAMLQMGTSFSGVTTDVLEGDFSNADRGYAEFRTQYGKLSELIPEWKAFLPTEPLDALGQALASRDAKTVMPAVDGVSAVCHACHVQNMTLVQQKYHWGDFQGIALTDPVSGADTTFPLFMRMLDGDLSGVTVDLAEGQPERAREHAAGLEARYATLEESCGACHDTERLYYVDSSIQNLIHQLRSVLDDPAVEGGRVQELVQGIGMESCHKCHLVHGPAALAAYTSGSGQH